MRTKEDCERHRHILDVSPVNWYRVRNEKKTGTVQKGKPSVYWLFFFWVFGRSGDSKRNVRDEWHQKTAASLYLLAAFADNSLDKGEYFLQVLKMRESVFLISAPFVECLYLGAFGGDGNFYIWAFAQGLFLLCPFFSLDFRGGIVGLGSLVSSVPLILSLLFLADVADIPAVSGNLEEPWADCREVSSYVSRSFMRSGLYGRNFAGNLVQSSGYGGSDEKPGAFLKQTAKCEKCFDFK